MIGVRGTSSWLLAGGIALAPAIVLTGACSSGTASGPSPAHQAAEEIPPPPADPDAPAPRPPSAPPVAPQPPSSTKTLGGAADAVRYFFEAYGYARQIGSGDAVRRIVDDECEFCTGILARIAADAAEGKRVIGGATTVVSHEASWDGGRDRAVIDVVVTRAQATILGPDGTVVGQETGETTDARVGVRRDDDGWRVIDVH